MLTLTYCIALCLAATCWRRWWRNVNDVSIGPYGRRVLVCAYWLLSFTIIGALFASLGIRGDDVTPGQFSILLGLAVGIMPQVAVFALVVTPFVMRRRPRKYSFAKALIVTEGCAVVSIIMLAIALIMVMHYRADLLHLL